MRRQGLEYRVKTQIRSFRPKLFAALFSALLSVALGGSNAFAGSANPLVLTLPASATDAQIQKALDELPPKGEVDLPAGTFLITQPILLRHNDVTLRGDGPSTVLRLADGANCPVVILGPPMNVTQHSANHLHLASLLIDGNRKHQKSEFWKWAGDGSEFNNNGVQVWNATGCTVEHVICHSCRSGGLVTASVRQLNIHDFDAYDNQYDGLACYETEDSHFKNLRLHNNLAAGISLDLAFNHNSVENAILSDNDLGIFMRYSRDNSFRGLTISHSRHHGVFMAETVLHSAKGWMFKPSTACTGNTFENLTVNDCEGKAFQVNDAACINNVITGASFLHNSLGGLCQPATNPVVIHALAGR